jgi:hypothetical protein
MAYRIAGNYVAGCDCAVLCPCPVDGKPTGPGDQCLGVAVFNIKEGNLDETDLGGVAFSLYNHFPSNISAGNWRVGIVVDESASDEQAQAVERIVSGDEGGPFGEFKPLIGEYVGMQRGSVKVEGQSGAAGDIAQFQFEPFEGPDGTPTKVRNAMFGFAPEYTVGRTSGTGAVFGETINFSYGEGSDFEFSTEAAGEVHPRAGENEEGAAHAAPSIRLPTLK